MVMVYQLPQLGKPFRAHRVFHGELPRHTFALGHTQMEASHLIRISLFLVHHRMEMQRQHLRP